jgi:4-nitrophenyl phosphatase
MPTKPSLSSINALILDMDGVLWRDQQPIGDLPTIFQAIERSGRKVVLATNNATLSVAQYLDKLRRFGVELQSWQIVNSPEATAQYLKKRFPEGGSVYIIGEAGLRDTLKACNFHYSETDVCAVVAGLDRQFNYEKLKTATHLIRSGALFIGTNPDPTFPTPQGLVPGAGAILAALQAATDVEPIIIGKPSVEMYRLALERLNARPEETLVVGDRLETDIIGAQRLGCRAALVLSGVTSESVARSWQPAPDWIAMDLTEVIALLTKD